MELPFYVVDAFTNRCFGGNPAAVVFLADPLPDATLQAIAAEQNLSETAFVSPGDDAFRLRWFTPTIEVDLCGHATLASAFAICELREPGRAEVAFDTRSGRLEVSREPGPPALYRLDLPTAPPAPIDMVAGFERGVGRAPKELLGSTKMLAVFECEADVAALEPDMGFIASLDALGLIATAPGDDCDFVSRFFAPKAGIDEDPVTGSAHCVLVPYWANRLGKRELFAKQISARGGELRCEHRGSRTTVAGNAVLTAQGTLYL